MSNDPLHITVEVVSSGDVKRLEARDDDVLAEVKKLEQQVIGLRRTVYELMEALGRLRDKW